MKNDWIVTVYNYNDTIAEEYKILSRTEIEAHKEAESYVETMHCGLDWTMMPI